MYGCSMTNAAFAVDEACELLVAYPDSGVIASLVR
jgi:hypothetical protein